jgi:hypothetical protein
MQIRTSIHFNSQDLLWRGICAVPLSQKIAATAEADRQLKEGDSGQGWTERFDRASYLKRYLS